MNGTANPGSLSEGAAERSEAEGVSSDGSSGPMVYLQFFIGSEIFERLRSSKYTPSVSHSLDSSLREGAGNAHHSTGYSLNREGSGDFHRPYEMRGIYLVPFNVPYNNANSSFFCSSTLGSSSMYCSGNLGLWKRCNAPPGRLTLFIPPPPKERMVCTSSIM